MKVSLRIGFRMPVFVNGGVVVIQAKEHEANQIIEVVATLRTMIRIAGNGAIADRLICEIRK